MGVIRMAPVYLAPIPSHPPTEEMLLPPAGRIRQEQAPLGVLSLTSPP